nr:uncharacterized protein LOC129264850 [Lytechinus pictus]
MERDNESKSTDEWELSKENVLPLKQGRKMTNLTAALQPQNFDRQQQLILQRQGFETELRTYNGDDPLDPWIRYIQWTEQNFPQGGKDSHLGVLIQKCIIQFKNNELYKQDSRYVSIWLKMYAIQAQYDSESLEIFKFMQANQIGTKLTLFYEAWASELEQAGNTKRADAIYKEGLACNAQPRERLERAMIEFQSRVGRTTVQQMQEGMMNPTTSSEDQRATLGDLRARGKHQKIGTSRTGAAKLSSRGGIQTASAPLQQRTNQISIFCDDDVQSSGAAKPTGQWQHLPSRAESRKENTTSAGQWANQRLPQRNVPRMTFQEVSSYSRPDFDVHVDENVDQITTPHKPPEMGYQVLSEKKHHKPTNALHAIKQENVNDNTRVMYCKHLIYGGAREMSFEELRGIKDRTKRKEREIQAKMEEAERMRVDMVRKQKEQDEMIAKMQEKLEQQRIQQEQYIELLVKQKMEAMAPQMSQQVQPTAVHPTPTLPPQPAPMAPAYSAPMVPQQPAQVAPSQPAPTVPTAQYALSQEGFQTQGSSSKSTGLSHTSPLDSIVACENITKQRNRSNSGGDSTITCTKQLLFDDLTSATGNFNIFCDPDQDPPAKPAPQYPTVATAAAAKPPSAPLMAAPTPCNPSSTSAFSIHPQPVTAPLSKIRPQTEQDTITPNQSFLSNTSSTVTQGTGLNDEKTPQSSMMSDKTPSSASFASLSRSRNGRLNQIRTPKGLTAPSPTINTKEALGVINAMLNCSLKSNQFDLDAEFQNQVTHKEKEFEMEFANESSDVKPLSKGAIFEDASADNHIRGFVGQGIIPRRQPLAPRMGQSNEAPQQVVPSSSAFSSIPIYQDDVKTEIKEAGAGKITIFEDEPVDNTKENTPPSDYKQVKDRREMTGILQSSKGVPFMPLEDQEQEEDGVEAMEVHPSSDPSQQRDHTMNITLPPTGAGSNYSFDLAARMASTPFNDASSHKLSFIPPMSTIKPREVEQSPTKGEVVLPSGASDVGGLKVGASASRVVHTSVNESFEKTEFTVNHSGGHLSPIMETSAENARSSASSSASTTNSHASASSLEGHQSSINTQVEREKNVAPSVQGFSIHMDEDPPVQCQKQAGSLSLGFQIHVDNPEPISAALEAGNNSCAQDHHVQIGGAELSRKELSFNTQSLVESQPKSNDNGLLHKDDLPNLEMSFIPDRTIQDVEQVEEDITVFGMRDEPLDYSDPFNAGLQNLLLAGLSKPLSMYKGIYQHEQVMQEIKSGLAVSFGDEIHVFNVMKKVGEGAFATIYLAACLDAQDMNDIEDEFRRVALKVQHPPCPWEMYIIKELHARISRLPSQIDVRPSLMNAECAHIYQDRSCLVTEYETKGTLLDFINTYKQRKGRDMREQWVLILAIEILQVIEHMHRCKIIHGDIKPDNFLINSKNDEKTTCNQDASSGNFIKLIDFGRSIDMTLFPEGTTFTAKCKTSGFNCTEMQSNQPWTYQVDYYGIAGTIHCMMFGKYMKVFKERGIWKMTSTVPRKCKANWKGFFHTLLNVPSCDPSDLPHLGDLRRQLEQYVDPSTKLELQFNVNALL